MEMSIVKLFEVQRKLDVEIERVKPTAPGEDRLSKRILALLVELGECANEWRGFKFWSENQEPRKELIHRDPHGQCAPVTTNPLLEEYVDCLHFALSIGNAFYDRYGKGLPLQNVFPLSEVWEISGSSPDEVIENEHIVQQFSGLFAQVGRLTEKTRESYDAEYALENYSNVMCLLCGLGEMLGFNWPQVEEAYMSKNATNHKRQHSGY